VLEYKDKNINRVASDTRFASHIDTEEFSGTGAGAFGVARLSDRGTEKVCDVEC